MVTNTAVLRELDELSTGAGWHRTVAEYLSGTAEWPAVKVAVVAAYLGRWDEAEAALDEVGEVEAFLDDRGPDGDRARAALGARAELAFGRGLYEEARRLGRALTDSAKYGRPSVAFDARYLLARTAMRAAEYDLAEAILDTSGRFATCDYQRGKLAFIAGLTRHEAGDSPKAVPSLRAAIDLLDRSEGLRVTAMARNAYAGAISDLGRYEAAASEYEDAIRAARSFGDFPFELAAVANLARVHCLAGRSDLAVGRLEHLIEVQRRERQPGEMRSLYWLSTALRWTGDLERARVAAREMELLAEVAGTKIDRISAEIALGRVERTAEAADRLRAAAAHFDAANLEYGSVDARLALAEALAEREPAEAADVLGEAEARAGFGLAAHFAMERDRVRAMIENVEAAARDEIGSIEFRPSPAGVDLRAESGRLERFFLRWALAEARGNQKHAARLLNMSPGWVSGKRREHDL